jgi:hypothetical protein
LTNIFIFDIVSTRLKIISLSLPFSFLMGKTTDRWSDSSHWGKSSTSSSGQKDYYVGKNDGSGSHCHGYNNNGNQGVVHRGDCKVCDDVSSSSGK